MSKNEKIILIGTLPPPYDGQSIAFKTLANSFIEHSNCKVINISDSISNDKTGRSYIIYRAFDYIIVLIKLVIYLLCNYRYVYLQISQSRKGFLRDRIIINLAKLFNSKVVIHLHGGNYNNFYNELNPYLQNLVRRTLRKVDKLIVLSDRFLNIFDFEPILKNKIVSIPNGTELKVEIVKGKTLALKNQPIKILYLSNLIQTKGYLLVLEAVRILIEKYNLNVKASFCGKFSVNNDISSFASVEEAKKNFFETIVKYNFDNIITYEGVVTGDIKQAFLNEAHFFVLPTQYVNEGQPISIIEAMRAGCVVITSDYRAMPEMIVNGVNGYLLNSISADEIANLIYNTVNNKTEYEKISINAIKTYNSKYTSEIHCAAIISEIKSL